MSPDSPERSRPILITGGSGQVGEALTRTLAHLGPLAAPGRDQLDLSDPSSIRRVLRELQPRWVVNAGAYTAVDKAESEPELARAINADAPAILAEEAARTDTPILHFSTDYVFDGAKPAPYVETDPTGPLNVYGASKLAGEAVLASSGVPHLVFRTSWVYGATGKNFLRSILKLAGERAHLRIVGDQHGAPTWSFELARMTAHLVSHFDRLAAETGSPLAELVAAQTGVYHATAAGETTWHGFAATAIEGQKALQPGTPLAALEAIPTEEYPTPAARPRNSRLDCGKLAATFAWTMPEWRDSLAHVLQQLR